MLRANRSTRRSSGSNTQLGDSGTNRISLTRFTSTAGVSIWLLRPLNSRKRHIYYGKLIADGTPNSLRELPDVQPQGTLRVEITTPEVTRALRFARHLPGIRSATIFGQSIHALIEDRFNLDELREQLMKNGITVTEIRPLAPSLEDVFVELTYKHQALLEAARA